MSKKANPTVIGVFIIAGLALGVAGLIVFSSGNLFSKKHKYILYFDGSMKGMNKGAPVQLKGVTIGSVLDVYISHNEAPSDRSSPVIIEIDEATLHEYTDRRVDLASREAIEQLVAKGLRGKLDAASFITGVLMVELNMEENAPPPVYHQIKPEYLEIPTMPTTIQMLLANLGKLDIKGMTDKLHSILTRLDTTLGDLNVKAISDGVTNLLASVNSVVSSPELTNTLIQIQATVADLRPAIQGLSTMTAPDAPLQTELTGALNQLDNAARSIAELAEFLKRNPDALITGRTPPKEKP